jgi:hypothetical protein
MELMQMWGLEDFRIKAVTSVLIAFSLTMLTATPGNVLADAESAQKTFLSYCSTCHSPDWALQAVKSEENWRLTIKRMSLQYKMFGGKEIPLADQETILEHLLHETGGT